MFELGPARILGQWPEEHAKQSQELDRPRPGLGRRQLDTALAAEDVAQAFDLGGCKSEGIARLSLTGSVLGRVWPWHALILAIRGLGEQVGERAW